MRPRCLIIVFLLAIHAVLLAWQDWRNAPTVDEVAHLPAGLSHWTFGRFDLYRVNPPLVRGLAALPLLLVEPETDWRSFTEDPYARPEFAIGRAFGKANGLETFWYYAIARWTCIPLSLLGASVCYCWSRDLYGRSAGLVALALWCFCPNILGNAAQITPDAPAASTGVLAAYLFWRWLRAPGWQAAILAGLCLGVALLTKSTWIVLLALWPALWLVWICAGRKTGAGNPFSRLEGRDIVAPLREMRRGLSSTAGQLAGVLAMAVYFVNVGYAFENSFQRLDSFAFISRALGGSEAHTKPGNRFAGHWIGSLPVPLPANYLTGIDVQRFDFERGKWSYLRGEQKEGGWWYYYLYAMGVKIPGGTLALLGLTCVLKMRELREWGKNPGDRAESSTERPIGSPTSAHPPTELVELRPAPEAHAHASHVATLHPQSGILDEFVLLAPAVIVIGLVSSQTGFNRYVRYVLPCFPFLFIWASQGARRAPFWGGETARRAACGISGGARTSIVPWLAAVFLTASIVSSLAVFPHSLSYFNELAGGPKNGPAHLLDANIDWGQDLLYLKRWYDQHPEARPFHLAWFGFTDPRNAGLEFEPVPQGAIDIESPDRVSHEIDPAPGWYAISVNELHGYNHIGRRNDDYAWLRCHRPTTYAGYSVMIYRFPAAAETPVKTRQGVKR